MPYIMTVMSLFASDTIIKDYVEKHKKIGEAQPWIHGKIIIKKSYNKGAMMNLGEKKPSAVALLSLVLSAVLTGVFVGTLGMKEKKLLKTGLALILGGAYSNTYDRLKRKYVVDYFSFKKLDAIVFNLSDFGIIIGAVLLVYGTVHS